MTATKERPILFSAPMVRAILDGRKTVTRRPVKPQPEVRMVDMIGPMLTFENKRGGHWLYPNAKQQIIEDCPYGQPGDRLWVQEAWAIAGGMPHDPGYVVLRSEFDGDYDDCGNPVDRWRTAETMDRDDCRVELEITSVRFERLQDISRADIRAEGLQCPPELASDDVSPNYRDWYPAAWKELWNSTGGDWDANPWVWVVEFKLVQP
ncbi:ASCH domain-containing protein [Pseudomonas atacamensis]|uniref:hypothetical protein n=1 Tax=Pseudomonas atacamensis TaxID=2565368 RepID=UPI001CC02011|nr:hypothetical protein [Pseudomonas atacamensis]